MKEMVNRLGTAEKPEVVHRIGQRLHKKALLINIPSRQGAAIGLDKLDFRSDSPELVGQPVSPSITAHDHDPATAPIPMCEPGPQRF